MMIRLRTCLPSARSEVAAGVAVVPAHRPRCVNHMRDRSSEGKRAIERRRGGARSTPVAVKVVVVTDRPTYYRRR
jgi:hypothetical protein